MKLVDLIQYFRNDGSYEDFCESQNLNTESEVIEIYMEKPVKIGNNLNFFEIEKTEGNIEYTSNGIEYSNLFDFYYFLDVIEEANNSENQSLSDKDLTILLYNYAINDA